MRSLAAIWLSLLLPLCASAQPSPVPGSVLLTPCEFGGTISGVQGLIVVPENRSRKDRRISYDMP